MYFHSHQSQGQSTFHADPVDADDFDSSPNVGNPGDASLHIVAFREGLRSGPWRDVIDPALIAIAIVPGTSIGMVIYEHPVDGPIVVGVAHVDRFGSVGMVSVSPRFEAAVERMRGTVAA